LTDLAVVVLERAADDGPGLAGLVPLLGAGAVANLDALLTRRTARWALAAAAEGAAFCAVAEDGADPPDGLEPFAQRGATPGERRAAALAEAARRTGLPAVLVTEALPALGPHHAWALADDLADGIDVTFGPANDGDYYLLAAREPRTELFAIDPSAWGGERVLQLSLEAAVAAGLSVGWLRSERGLATPADVAALLADPATPPDVRDALRPSSAPPSWRR